MNQALLLRTKVKKKRNPARLTGADIVKLIIGSALLLLACLVGLYFGVTYRD